MCKRRAAGVRAGREGAGGRDLANLSLKQRRSSHAGARLIGNAQSSGAALNTLLRRLAIGTALIGILGTFWCLKAQTVTVIEMLAEYVNSAGAWGVVRLRLRVRVVGVEGGTLTVRLLLPLTLPVTLPLSLPLPLASTPHQARGAWLASWRPSWSTPSCCCPSRPSSCSQDPSPSRIPPPPPDPTPAPPTLTLAPELSTLYPSPDY